MKRETNPAPDNRFIWNRICEKINSFSNGFDGIKSKLPEKAVLFLYIVFHCLVSAFHEACFDEAHAWNIARDASIGEVLFEIPHWEGHPSLWHLILMPFAKTGMEYQLSMMIITLLFSVVAVYLLLFKSPFPRLLRLIIPFSYFFFYQYGVIARPYCMMITAFMFTALFYGDRNRKPGKYVFSLIFLCATSAFGVAFSAGLACAWLIEIVSGYITKKNSELTFFTDKRLLWLAILLGYAVFLLLRAWPENEIGAMSYYDYSRANSALVRLLYLLFGLFADLFFMNTYTQDYLADFAFIKSELALCCILGLLIFVFIVILAIKFESIKEFIIPYVFFTLFSVYVYFCVYNSGIPFLFLVFWAWITIEKNGDNNKGREAQKVSLRKYLLLVCLVAMIFPVIWSASSAVTDICSSYTSGREEAEFLIDNNLNKLDICVEWQYLNNSSEPDKIESYDIKHNLIMDRLAAYLDSPQFVNWPLSYSLYVCYNTPTTKEQQESCLESLKKNPKPSVLVGEPKLAMLNGADYMFLDDYTEVFRETTRKTWKGISTLDRSVIYVRKDIWEK